MQIADNSACRGEGAKANSFKKFDSRNIEVLLVLGPIFKITKTCKSCMWSTTYSAGPMDKNYRDCLNSPPANRLLNFFTPKKKFVCPKCGGRNFEEKKTVVSLG